ncbi:hypothetical protein [Streptantibioticus ferralitis]|uniref:Uncharacterized protein n=1 Tax=Streptantibioticus ferralitis TaxID=236510 RepID=A0ABT5YS84_9ACTN|nr:hypothetical protein [Streptantibioticus ferralitis]MDF2254353.1 hypothetical protein [Streptantibioticus ferralitis]
MIADRTATRAELAELLDEAAERISAILTTSYPTPTSRSYLHPVLGALSTGPQIIGELSDRLEALVAQPLPVTPAGLLAVASYASALGWLTESLGELTVAVERICTHVGIPDTAPNEHAPPRSADETAQDSHAVSRPLEEVDFTALELAAIRAAADAADLTPGDYVEALSQALRAASRITDACTEICEALLDDAAYIREEAADHIRIGAEPGSLPTLVRILLARMKADQ